jgi:hypothetical protein
VRLAYRSGDDASSRRVPIVVWYERKDHDGDYDTAFTDLGVIVAAAVAWGAFGASIAAIGHFHGALRLALLFTAAVAGAYALAFTFGLGVGALMEFLVRRLRR